MGSPEMTLLCTTSPVQNICQDIYVWLFQCVKSLLSQGTVKQLCYGAPVELRTGKTSGEAGDTTSTGSKSWQHSLQRLADVTMLTQSLPKSSFVWIPSVASIHIHNCSRTQSRLQGNKHTHAKTLSNYSYSASWKRRVGVFLVFPFFYPHSKHWDTKQELIQKRWSSLKRIKIPETSSASLPRRSCYFTSMPAEVVDSSLGLSSDFLSLINQLHM